MPDIGLAHALLMRRIRERRDRIVAEQGCIPPDLVNESALLDEIDRLYSEIGRLQDRADSLAYQLMGDDL